MPFAQYRLGRKDGPADFFLATPSGSGAPAGNYTMALADSIVELTKAGLAFDYWLHTGDCHVDDARNFMVRQFMISGAPLMVFIDDDVGWDAADLIKLVTYKDADVVAGCYPLKQDNPEDYPIRVINAKEFLQARPDGLLEVEGVPTGFMAIRRHVLEAMEERRKHMKFLAPGFPKTERLHQVIFERALIKGSRWSGDLNFCREAREMGFKVWVAPEMHFTHEGRKRWKGHLGNWLRQHNGLLNPALDEAFKKVEMGDTSPDVFNTIWRENNNSFSASAEMLKVSYDLAQKSKGPILECGSGLTTLVMGFAVQKTGQVIHTLEHEIDWYRRMRNMLRLYALRPVRLYYTPLQEHGGEDLMWYEVAPELPASFGLVVIDGPPRRFGREGVYKLMLDRIKDADWIVDDVDDAGQLEMLKRYAEPLGKKIECFGMPSPYRQFAVVTNP